MAIKVLKTSGNLSTSGGNYETVGAYNLVPNANIWTSTAWAVITTTRTLNVTFSANGNQLGLMLHLRSTGATGTITIVLKEGTTARTTDVFTVADLGISNKCGWYYFPLTSYAVTTAAATWKYEITASLSGTASVTTASGTDLLYAVTIDTDNTKVGAGDTLFLGNGVTLTIDEAASFAPINQAAIYCCIDSSIAWANPPSSSFTLTLTGTIWLSNTSNFSIGSAASPISVANRAIIDATGNAVGTFFTGTASPTYWGSTYGGSFELYGVQDTKIATRIASDAAASQADIVTTVDMSSDWAIGDHLSIIGKQKRGNDAVAYTISGISGTTITLNTNLDYKVPIGAAVVNLDRKDECGIWMLGRTLGHYFIYHNVNHVHVVGTYFDYMTISGAANYHYGTKPEYYVYIKNVLTATYTLGNYLLLQTNGYSGYYIENLFDYSTNTSYRTGGLTVSGSGSKNHTITNIFVKNCYSTSFVAVGCNFIISGNNMTISGLVGGGGRVRADSVLYPYINMYLSGSGNTISDIFNHAGGGNYGLCLSGLHASTITGLVSDGAADSDLVLNGNVDLTITNAKLGKNDPATVSEMFIPSDTLNRVLFNSVDPGTITALTSNFGNSIPSSYLKLDTYDLTANDHRSLWANGDLQSTGDGLTDTTVHTSGTGKFALRFEPKSSTDSLTWDVILPTGSIINKTMTVGVWCKINSATYYAGTNQLPRLTINYDNGTTAYSQAAQSTDWQLLYVAFTPTTTYGQVTVTLSARTDATTTNAYIYWDDFMVAYPPSVALDLGGMDNWANALPVTPPIALPISAQTVSQSVWQQLTTTSWGTGTMGEKLKSNKNANLLLGGQIIV